MTHPIDQIQWMKASDLTANDWNPNVVFNPELKLLERSILATGWIQPILVNPNNLIIDGFHRVRIAMESKTLIARDAGMVPCAVLDVSDPDARLMTIRINRAKGSHVSIRMSAIIQDLIDRYEYTPEEIATAIGATKQELDLLYAGDVFAAKDIKNAKYSKAWVPVETA
jgi:ParB-like chromosome segregation protein Spo0J